MCCDCHYEVRPRQYRRTGRWYGKCPIRGCTRKIQGWTLAGFRARLLEHMNLLHIRVILEEHDAQQAPAIPPARRRRDA